MCSLRRWVFVVRWFHAFFSPWEHFFSGKSPTSSFELIFWYELQNAFNKETDRTADMSGDRSILVNGKLISIEVEAFLK